MPARRESGTVREVRGHTKVKEGQTTALRSQHVRLNGALARKGQMLADPVMEMLVVNWLAGTAVV